MDEKLNRYHNYVIDEIMEDTFIVNKGPNYINIPFSRKSYGGKGDVYEEETIAQSLLPFYGRDFKKLVMTRYGISNEEIRDLWEMYNNRIRLLFKGYEQ